MYDIEYSQNARDDLAWFKKNEQNTIVDAIGTQLRFEPLIETQNRKEMQPNAWAEWELRVGKFRVLYNVDNAVRIVGIQKIGEKRRNEFYFRGKREDV